MTPIRLASPRQKAPFRKTDRSVFTSARALFETPAGFVLAGSIVCFLLALLYCRHLFWRDPQSLFFDSSTAYDLQYTLQRQSEARDFINNAEASRNAALHEPTQNPVICVGIITVKREIQYVNETIGSLLVGLTDEERSALSVNLLFADIEPSIHPDWNRQWLDILDWRSGYNVTEEQLDLLREWKEKKLIRDKAIFDYSYILDQCVNQTTAPYIAVFEDDLIFADGWLAKTLSALSEIRQKPTPWLYLRLFYTDIMIGWDKDIDRWYSNPIFNYVVAMVIVYAFAFAVWTRKKRSYPDTDHTALRIITCLTIPAFVTLFFMIGSNSLSPMHGLERMDYKGCCTQALIFPRSQVADMAQALRSPKADQTDLIMEEYANKMGLARYALAPQVVQHVGLVSSRGTTVKNSQTNWAFHFEANDAKKLRKEHEELARWGIWRASDDGFAHVTGIQDP